MARKATIAGVSGTIRRSSRKGKKWAFVPSNPKRKTIHAGQVGAKIRPGTPAGNNYCKRSAGIRGGKGYGANALARYMWNCRGTKSVGRKSRGL